MVVLPRARARSGRAWVVAVAVVLLVAVVGAAAVWVYVDRQHNTNTGPDPEAARRQADLRIQSLQEQFKAYSEGDLDFRNLLPEVRRFVTDYPDRTDGQRLLGQLYAQLGRWDDALAHFDRALEIDPDDAALHELAGTCAGKLGRWDEAESHLKSAMAMRTNRDLHLMLGNVYFQTERYDLAEQQYATAITTSAQSPPHKAYSGLADLRSREDRHDEALRLVDDAIDWGAHDADVKAWTYPLQKVRILMDAGQMDAAGAYLIAVIDAEPEATYTLAYVKLQARLWSHQGRAAVIPGVYEDLVSRLIADPDRDTVVLGEALADLAYWRLELDQPERAAQTLRSLRSVRPDHPRLGELESRLATDS
ncbi:MAG: tetratricopeptide repeat protein [Planctomycetota bacterium]